jgi:hypothetical protein
LRRARNFQKTLQNGSAGKWEEAKKPYRGTKEEQPGILGDYSTGELRKLKNRRQIALHDKWVDAPLTRTSPLKDFAQ